VKGFFNFNCYFSQYLNIQNDKEILSQSPQKTKWPRTIKKPAKNSINYSCRLGAPSQNELYRKQEIKEKLIFMIGRQ